MSSKLLSEKKKRMYLGIHGIYTVSLYHRAVLLRTG